jgi:hypothetical protein
MVFPVAHAPLTLSRSLCIRCLSSDIVVSSALCGYDKSEAGGDWRFPRVVEVLVGWWRGGWAQTAQANIYQCLTLGRGKSCR